LDSLTLEEPDAIQAGNLFRSALDELQTYNGTLQQGFEKSGLLGSTGMTRGNGIGSAVFAALSDVFSRIDVAQSSGQAADFGQVQSALQDVAGGSAGQFGQFMQNTVGGLADPLSKITSAVANVGSTIAGLF